MSRGTTTQVERRKQVHTLRCAGNDWATIAQTIGLKESTCKAYFQAAVTVDGLPVPQDRAGVGSKIIEREADIESVAETMVTAMDPFLENMKQFREVCKKNGVPPRIVGAMERRMRVQFAPVVAEGKRIQSEEMLDMIREKMYLIASYMDEYAVSMMSGKDLSVAMGILVDRHELLSGRPTQRVDFTAHLQITESLPLLLAEAKRRGVALDTLPMVERVQTP